LQDNPSTYSLKSERDHKPWEYHSIKRQHLKLCLVTKKNWSR